MQEISVNSGAAGDQLGYAAALSGDAAVVGAPGSNGQRGLAYVIARSGGTWSQGGKLAAADGAPGDQLGSAVAISGDTAIVGAFERASAQGTVYAFVKSSDSWVKQQELTAPDGVAGDRFGWTVGITGDTAIMGTPARSSNQGAAYVFARSASTWSLVQTLGAADGAMGDSFGYGAAIDGTTSVVGALYSADNQGAAYVFVQGDAGAVPCGSGSGAGNGSGSGNGGGTGSNPNGGAGGSQEERDLKDHIPFAFGGCGCRVAGPGGGGLGALAVAALAAGLAARRRRR